MKGHYEHCHFDPNDNFLIVFSGRKHVRLFPACYVEKGLLLQEKEAEKDKKLKAYRKSV